MKLVTLSSDFGTENEGPGIMEATVLSICAEARVVHLSHGIDPYDVIDGARQMECVCTIPPGVHVCVVDPSVGTVRRGIVLDAPSVGYLVGPDNGVLLAAARRAGGIRAARAITNRTLLLRSISTTFHGRDVFAAVAGHLAAGVPFDQVGPQVPPSQLAPAPYDDAQFAGAHLDATVIHVNRFGNCILNVLEAGLRSGGASQSYEMSTGGLPLGACRLADTFCAVPRGLALLYPDSYGRVGLALNQGSAAAAFGLRLGSRLALTTRGEEA